MENDPFLAPASESHVSDYNPPLDEEEQDEYIAPSEQEEVRPRSRRTTIRRESGRKPTANRLRSVMRKTGFSTQAGFGMVLYPWTLFTVVLTCFTFFYYGYPAVVWGVSTLAAVIALVMASSAFSMGEAKSRALPSYLAVMSIASVFIAIFLGRINYRLNLKAYYMDQERQGYTNVMASDSSVKYNDASRITFALGTNVNTDLSVGYLKTDMFCIAPIVDPAIQTNINTAPIQFWAVGKNCCEATGRFTCGEVNRADSRGGVVMEPKVHWVEAADKAEAVWGLQSAPHPIFIEWVMDPDATVDAKYRNAIGFLIAALVGYMILTLALGAVAAATLRSAAQKERDYGEV